MTKFPGSDAILVQFNLLMDELLEGGLRRGKFAAWEIDILLDIESCELRVPLKRELLVEYQKAVQAELQQGIPSPMRFSKYLDQREVSRLGRMQVKGASRAGAKSAPGKAKSRAR
jgi:hypothetical protein